MRNGNGGEVEHFTQEVSHVDGALSSYAPCTDLSVRTRQHDLEHFEPQSRAALLYMMTNPAYVLSVFHDASE